MKRYNSIGELLLDYRKLHKLSQADLAARLDVDIRTVQRWENGTTLIKPDKEEDIIRATLLPYQLVRNLNGSIPIPTYYDFSLRKYSTSDIHFELPGASWFKEHMNRNTDRIRTLDYDRDMDTVASNMRLHKEIGGSLKEVIRESARLLPEMNLVILDDSGFYSGHALIFPIRDEAYEKLRSRKMTDKEFRPEDLNDPKLRDRPVFYGFDITADCNDNIYYLVGKLFRALQRIPIEDYVYCATPYRFDNFRLNKQLGLQIIWEEARKKNLHGMDIAPRFQEGNFRDFLSEKPAS